MSVFKKLAKRREEIKKAKEELEKLNKELKELNKQLSERKKERARINAKLHFTAALLRFMRYIAKGGVACYVFAGNELVKAKYLKKGENTFVWKNRLYEIPQGAWKDSCVWFFGVPTFFYVQDCPRPLIWDTEITEPKVRARYPTAEEYALWRQNEAIRKILTVHRARNIDWKTILLAIGVAAFILVLFMP